MNSSTPLAGSHTRPPFREGDWGTGPSVGDNGGPDEAGDASDESFETWRETIDGDPSLGTCMGSCDINLSGIGSFCSLEERGRGVCKGRSCSSTGEGIAVDKGKSGC